jgi:hypothetical protein
VESLERDEVVDSPDLTTDERWPTVSPVMGGTVHGVLSAPIRTAGRPAARVNLSEAGSFANHCVVAVSSFGSLIHTAVGSAGGSGGLRTKRSGCSP